jgi:hypothetical protein
MSHTIYFKTRERRKLAESQLEVGPDGFVWTDFGYFGWQTEWIEAQVDKLSYLVTLIAHLEKDKGRKGVPLERTKPFNQIYLAVKAHTGRAVRIRGAHNPMPAMGQRFNGGYDIDGGIEGSMYEAIPKFLKECGREYNRYREFIFDSDVVVYIEKGR